MFFLMLNPRFKTVHLVSSLIGCEQHKVIVEEYDTKKIVSYAFKMSLSFTSFG